MPGMKPSTRQRRAPTSPSSPAPGQRSVRRITLFSACALPAVLLAMAGPALAGTDAMHVDGTRLTRPLADTPTAVSVIDSGLLREPGIRLQLDEWLDRVPGLFTQNRYNFAQGQRLATRGFGARSAFGVRGIRIRVDGFPETLPDGQSQIDAIDLDAVRGIEVLRGASSVPYGNAGGGVISLRSEDGTGDAQRLAVRVVGGGDGLRKTNLRSGGDGERLFHHLSLTHLEYDGWREQSAVRKTLLQASAGYRLDEQRQLRAVLTAMHLPRGEDPGGLTRAQRADDPRQATPAARNLDAGQRVDQQRIGLVYEDAGLGPGQLTLRLFHQQRDFAQQLPFPGASRIGLDRRFQGLGADYALAGRLGDRAWRASLGADLEQQHDRRRRHRVNAAGDVLALSQQEVQRATGQGAFAQGELDIVPTLSLSAGLRHDRLRLAIDDRMRADGDSSGERRYGIWSGSAGLLWRWHAEHRLYASVGSAFESPTFTEFARPDGGSGFNPDIEPQRSRSHELGLRGRLSDALDYELALYAIRVRDELVPYEIDGRSFFENAARTQRDGAELTLNWHGSWVQAHLGYAFGRYRFSRFEAPAGDDLADRRLPGLPAHSLFGELAWRGAGQRFISLESRVNSRIHADNANQVSVGGHALFNLRAGTGWSLDGGQLLLFAGLDNLFDRDYVANLRVNANPALVADARGYFEPGPGRQLWLGLEWRSQR